MTSITQNMLNISGGWQELIKAVGIGHVILLKSVWRVLTKCCTCVTC